MINSAEDLKEYFWPCAKEGQYVVNVTTKVRREFLLSTPLNQVETVEGKFYSVGWTNLGSGIWRALVVLRDTPESVSKRLAESLKPALEENSVITLRWVKGKIAGNFERSLSDVVIVSALLCLDCKMKRGSSQKYYITPKGLKEGYSEGSSPKQLEAALPKD